MATYIQNALRGYTTMILDDKYADPRTKDYFLMSSPGTVLMILVSYLYFCTKAGPRFMEGRKPYSLKNTLIVYNAIQVLISCYITYEGAKVWMNYNFLCAPIDYSDQNVAFLCWTYFFAKITELLDTVFFVLRKKYNQVSTLHLFHHTIMPFFTWFGVRYWSGGHATFLGVINSFVHIIMYSYYLVAGLGPEYQKYLWWKKHLTGLQLVQFVILFVHNMIPLFNGCNYPKFLNIAVIIFASNFIVMFGNFYVQNYLKNSKRNSSNKNK